MMHSPLFQDGRRHYREGRSVFDLPRLMTLEEKQIFVAGFAHEERFERRMRKAPLAVDLELPREQIA